MVIRKLLRFHFSFWLHFKIMSSIIATGMKNQTASLAVSASYCNKDRVMIFLNPFQLVEIGSLFTFLVGRSQQSVWTHQRNSCDSAVLLLSVPFPSHCCNFFALSQLIWATGTVVSEGFSFLIISLLRWPHEGATDKQTFISLAVVWVWMSKGQEGEILLLNTLMQARVSFEVIPDKQNFKPQSRWNFNLKFSIGFKISWNEMSGHCETCESLQVAKPQSGDCGASLLKTRNVNHLPHKIFRTLQEGQCQTSF